MEVRDMIQKLERERSRLLERAQEIEITLRTLRECLQYNGTGLELSTSAPPTTEHPTTEPPATEPSIPWSDHIRQLFTEHKQLATQRARQLLADRGLPVYEERYTGVVQATLSRLKRTGELIRVGKGVYRIKEVDTRRPSPPEDRGTGPISGEEIGEPEGQAVAPAISLNEMEGEDV